MKTFEQVLEELGEGAEPALLVANGFSQAWNPDVFNYANLLEKADFGASNEVLRGLFNHFQTYDFEKVMHQLLGAEAVAMGLANVCVPHEQLDDTVQEWAETICERSPTAIAIAKRSFNMDTAHQSGIAGMGMYALKLYYDTDESREGVNALKDKRKPEFRKYAK